MKTFRKTLALVLAIVLLIGALPAMSASALENIKLELDVPMTVSAAYDELIYFRFTPAESGHYVFYSESDYYCDPHVTLYDYNLDEMDESDDFDGMMFRICAYLEGGKTYYYHVGDWDGNNEEFTVCVEKAIGIENLEIVSYPDRMEYYEELVDAMFDPTGLEIKATMSDGTTQTWASEGEYSGIIGDYVLEVYLEDNIEDEYYDSDTLVIECGSFVLRTEITVVENPVESISVVECPPIEMYENESGSYDNVMERYIYDYDIPEELVLQINYKDGSYVTASYDDVVDNMTFGSYDLQLEDGGAWGVGENPVYITYAYTETQIPVTVMESPVKECTINSTPTAQYIYGDNEWGAVFEDGNYYFVAGDLTGLSFTLEFKDGTKKTYTGDDLDFETGNTVDGVEWRMDIAVADAPGDAKVTIRMYGTEVVYYVKVIESPVKSIEVIKDPDKTEYEYYYYPDFTGMQVKITYTDGTEKIVTANDDTLFYEAAGVEGIGIGTFFYIDVDGVNMYITEYGYDYDETVHYLSMQGVDCEYNGITYTESRKTKNIEVSNFTTGGVGTVADVEYIDGTNETIELDVLSFATYNEYTTGVAKTANGILCYEIEDVYFDGEVITHRLWILDGFVDIEATQPEPQGLLGDVDGDGKISVLDAAAIQRHLASIAELTDEQAKRADTDGDGRVSILDAAKIQQLLAHIIDEF